MRTYYWVTIKYKYHILYISLINEGSVTGGKAVSLINVFIWLFRNLTLTLQMGREEIFFSLLFPETILLWNTKVQRCSVCLCVSLSLSVSIRSYLMDIWQCFHRSNEQQWLSIFCSAGIQCIGQRRDCPEHSHGDDNVHCQCSLSVQQGPSAFDNV